MSSAKPLGLYPIQFRREILRSRKSTTKGLVVSGYILGIVYSLVLFVDIGNFLALEFGENEPLTSFNWWLNEISIGRILLLWLFCRAIYLADIPDENSNIAIQITRFLAAILFGIDALRVVFFAAISSNCKFNDSDEYKICYLNAGIDPDSAEKNEITMQFSILVLASTFSLIVELVILLYSCVSLPIIRKETDDAIIKSELEQNRIIENFTSEEGYNGVNSETTRLLQTVESADEIFKTVGDVKAAELRFERILLVARYLQNFFLFPIYIFFFSMFLFLEFGEGEPYVRVFPWIVLYIHGAKFLVISITFPIRRYLRVSTRVGLVRLFAVFIAIVGIADVITAVQYLLASEGDCDERFCYGTAGNGGEDGNPNTRVISLEILAIGSAALEFAVAIIYFSISFQIEEINMDSILADRSRGFNLSSQDITNISNRSGALVNAELDSISESGEYLNYLPPQKLSGLPRKSRKRRPGKELPVKASVVSEERRKGLYEGAKFD